MPDTTETPAAPAPIHLHPHDHAGGERQPTPEEAARELARERARVCLHEVQRLLDEYGCRIVTTIVAEQVGRDTGKAFLSAQWGVYPQRIDD